MFSIEKNMLIINGEDKTESVLFYRYNKAHNIYYVTYTNRKSYPYRFEDVCLLSNPIIVSIKDHVVYKNDTIISGLSKILFFNSFARLFYKNGFHETVLTSNINIVGSELNNPKSKNCFEYLKQISAQIGLIVDNHNILYNHFDKIGIVRDDSVLASYLRGELKSSTFSKEFVTVFPFGFNASQKAAVENALTNKISIIEGPPGTGKTQTILNIIANAVMHNKSVAVVSSNNSATANVFEKLKKYGVDFIAAPLGNSSNKEAFIESQNPKIPNIDNWNYNTDFHQLHQLKTELDEKLELQNELSKIINEENSLKLEYTHFKDFYNSISFEGKLPTFSIKKPASKILSFIIEYTFIKQNRQTLTLFKKLYFMFVYGLKNFSFSDQPLETIIYYCQNLYYTRKLKELDKKRAELQDDLANFDFESKMQNYSVLSMQAFKSALAGKYSSNQNRNFYKSEDLWKNSETFINDYPVVLSTTYSLRSSLSSKYIYDYVIIDEASQVDIATGALALSCAKNAVIVGDLKQLPNVVTQEQREATETILNNFNLNEAYSYSKHSLLSSILALFPNLPRVLLKEHYRCHPEIIGFCNKRFYNNELIVLSKPKSTKKPLMVYRTVPGNHARGHVNHRQIDVIVNEVFPQQNLNSNDNSVGIVTPYRNQANELQNVFLNTSVKADTADKFQGQERDVIIFSTVDNEIGDFVSDPNRLNVAVSRAVDQFIVVTDGNNNDSTSPIHELIGYIQYNNHDIINSAIHSVFDYLYQSLAESREKILQKYGKISDIDSENLMYSLICNVLQKNDFSKYGVASHVPLRMLLNDLTKLNTRELSFVTNHLTHIDFLIYSKLTHQPIVAIEVDGFSYHNSEKQQERDHVKNSVLAKYNIPILRFSTVGSGEEETLINFLNAKI